MLAKSRRESYHFEKLQSSFIIKPLKKEDGMKSLLDFVTKKVRDEISSLKAALQNRQSDFEYLDCMKIEKHTIIPIEVKIESAFKGDSGFGVCMIEGGDPKEITSRAIAKFKETHDGRDPIQFEITVCAILPNGTHVPLPEEFYR